ncbi:MAG: TIR domain-containing protein [Pseudomonadota bacterium]
MAEGTEPLFEDFAYDVAISYSRRDGELVEEFAQYLSDQGIRVFQDTLDHIVKITVGRDLSVELPRIYSKEAAYCVIFISEHYYGDYVRAELRAVLRRLMETEDYILPIRLDDATIEDLPPTLSYLDARPGSAYADRERLFRTMLGVIYARAGLETPGTDAAARMAPDPDPQPEAVPPAPATPATEPSRKKELSPVDYFQVILPAMLKWKGKAATEIGKTLRFVVTGQGGGTWTLRMKPPVAAVIGEAYETPDLTIKITSAEIVKMLSGTFNARQALIEGNVELNGDLTVLKPVGFLFQITRP